MPDPRRQAAVGLSLPGATVPGMPHRIAVFFAVVVAAAACGGSGPRTMRPADTTGPPTTAASAQESTDSALPPSPHAIAVGMIAVLDGDSLEVEIDGAAEEVRIRGINAPERDECWGDEARTETGDLVSGAGELLLDPAGRDQYGRLLADVWADGASVGLSLVRRGAALALSTGEVDAAAYVEAEEQAVTSASGMWAADACGPASDARIAIIEVNVDAPGADDENPNGEWAVIGTTGPDTELTGWVLRDESSIHRFEFPDGFVLAGGSRVVVYSGCGRDREDALFWCAGAVWNNAGDTALLLDPHGNIVDRVRS
jgi:endonuclease YncB( thermonuclease family)